MGVKHSEVRAQEFTARWEQGHALQQAKEGFIAASIDKEDKEEYSNQEAQFVDEFTKKSPQVSHEESRHLYETHTALHALHTEALQSGGIITPDRYNVLFALGYDLLRILSRKGAIPALMEIRGYEAPRFPALALPPSELFSPTVLEEFFFSGEYQQSDIFHALEFSHDVLAWNSNYYRTNRDVGVIPPDKLFTILDDFHKKAPGKDISEFEMRQAFRIQQGAGPAEANYLVGWRAVPFSIFKMVVESHALDSLPLKSRSYQISRVLKKCVDEIIQRRDYYNYAILEEPPRIIHSLEVLYLLKEHYAERPDVDHKIRDKIYRQFFNLVHDPKFKHYYDEDARKDFRNLIGVRPGEYEFE